MSCLSRKLHSMEFALTSCFSQFQQKERGQRAWALPPPAPDQPNSTSTSTDLPHQALPDPFGVCNNLLVSLFPASSCSCSSAPRVHCQHPCPGSLPHAHPTECVSWSLGLSPWQAHHEGYGYLHISSSRQITAKQTLGRLPGLHILHSSLWVYCWSKPVVSTTAFTRSKCHLGKEVCVFNSNQGWQRWPLRVGHSCFTRASSFMLSCRSQGAWSSSFTTAVSVLKPGGEHLWSPQATVPDRKTTSGMGRQHTAAPQHCWCSVKAELPVCYTGPMLVLGVIWVWHQDPDKASPPGLATAWVWLAQVAHPSSQREERLLGKGQWPKYKNT